jgi:hypothetical protein
MMIEPERLPDIPKPTMAPERIFVEPMAALPGYIPGPATQSGAGPIFQGISGAATAASSFAAQAAYYNRNSGTQTTAKVTPYAPTSLPAGTANPSYGTSSSLTFTQNPLGKS